MSAAVKALPSIEEEVRPKPSGVSARKSNVIRPIFSRKLHEVREQVAEDAKYILEVAFPGPSVNKICETACQKMGLADAGVIWRILKKETQKVDAALLFCAISHIPDPYSHPRIAHFVHWAMSQGAEQ
ncbi:MAG: hypothetical protein AAF405_00275 [Pseudomonadota bacterium]